MLLMTCTSLDLSGRATSNFRVMVDVEATVNPDDQGTGLSLVFEALSDYGLGLVHQNLEDLGQDSVILQGFVAVRDALREDDLPLTRVVITGDMVASVSAREDRGDRPFTRERGSAIVVAKTMPRGEDGVVDILIPAELVLEQPNDELRQTILHVAAHEAVHASLFHDGDEAFNLLKRRKYGDAMVQFVAMAGYQAEEHLAECISAQMVDVSQGMTAQQVKGAFDAWSRVLTSDLPAVPESDPDYFQKCMLITLNALHVLWKALTYLAAEVRRGDTFEPISREITLLEDWQKDVGPWWDEYTSLLTQIQMKVPVDIAATDDVVEQMARFLQRWAREIGIDYHDTPSGPWFRMAR